jgi:hypothetical protein
MAFEIVWEPPGVYKRYWGLVTAPEFIESVARLHGDPRFDRLRYVINDFLNIEGHEVSEKTIAGIAAVSIDAQTNNPNIRVALVTTDDAIKQLAWLFASRTLASSPVQIFATVADAREWVRNLPPLNRKRPLAHRT